MMPSNAALQNYSELFTSTQAYISGVQEDVRSFVRMIGVDRFPRRDLLALQEVADQHFEKATDLASVLWQNGLLGYIDDAGQRRFYSMGDIEEFHFPPEVGTYLLHPCLVHAVGGIRPVPPEGTRATDPRRTRLLPSSAPFPDPYPARMRSSAVSKAAAYSVGDVLDGRFEILQVVGQGSFSKVYRVRDDVEGEERALKLFDCAAGDEAVRREIGALRKIHHPNVVEVFWAGKTSGGDWYLITEFINGECLDEFVAGNKRLRDREAVDVALDLLAALVAIHPEGLVHRDIKPLNVMLTRTGAKLLDFNIASRIGDPVHTQSGTPPYRPPDAGLAQWDASTDLFAVGVVLYRLLCDGRHPYPDAIPMAGVPVIDPRTIRPDLAPDLAEFLIKACAPAHADRFSSAPDMRQALRDVRADL
jgi:hypothetical protein